MATLTDVFSATSPLGFIWDKLSGAGKNIMKTFSDHVIDPVKRSWNSRGLDRHQFPEDDEELVGSPVKAWQPLPWQPVPYTYFLPSEDTNIMTTQTEPFDPFTIPSTIVITRKKKSRFVRCRDDDSDQSPRCLRRRKSARQVLTTTSSTTTRKTITGEEIEASLRGIMEQAANNEPPTTVTTTTEPTTTTTTTTSTTTTEAPTTTSTKKPSPTTSKRCQDKNEHFQPGRKKTPVIMKKTTPRKMVARKFQKNKKDLVAGTGSGGKKVEKQTPKRHTASKSLAARRCQNSKNDTCRGSTNSVGLPMRIRKLIQTTQKPVARKHHSGSSKMKSVKKGIYFYNIKQKRYRPSVIPKKTTIGLYPVAHGNKTNVICRICRCADSAVDCSNKKIKPFDLVAWKGLVSFEPIMVDLSRNPLKTVSKFPKLPIQMLNLSSCHIHHFETSALTALDELTTLDLSYNKISASDLKDLSMPRDIFSGPRPFKRMQDLTLAHNSIYSLPQSMFRFMTNLTFLDLSDNPLAYIDSGTKAAISSLPQLRHLVLSNCELETLPKGLLRNQKKLRWLDLSNNRFTTVPWVLQEVPKLLFLSLKRNPIMYIESKSPITKLTSLEELHLSHMSRLQNITAGGIGGLVKLDVLRLNHNPRLTNLDPEFLVYRDEDQVPYWPTLRELHLNNNNLSSIDSQMLDDWYDLTDGDFSNNPYICDCNNQWMVNVLTPIVRNLPQRQTIFQMRCADPPNLKGVTFAYMSRTHKVLSCAENVSNKVQNPAFLISMSAMAGTLISVPFIIVFVIMIWKRLKNRSRRNDVHIRRDSDF